VTGGNDDLEQAERLAELVSSGALNELGDDQLEELLAAARAERRRRATPPGPRMSQRSVALDALDLIHLPSTPRLIAWVAEARSGVPFNPKNLTTGKRDDRARWERYRRDGRTPPPMFAPALSGSLFEPVRALLCLSTWPLESRVVTAHSPRADHPAALLAVLDEADRLAGYEPEAAKRLMNLASRLATGLPGGHFDVVKDPVVLRRVATEELGRFKEVVTDERSAAAKRAGMLADEGARIWGRSAASQQVRVQEG